MRRREEEEEGGDLLTWPHVLSLLIVQKRKRGRKRGSQREREESRKSRGRIQITFPFDGHEKVCPFIRAITVGMIIKRERWREEKNKETGR